MTARLAFPSEVDSTEVLAHVVTTAAINDANLRLLQARDPITATVDELAYLILAYDIAAEGELDDLFAFLTDLESGPVGTLSLDQVRLEVLPTPVPSRGSGDIPGVVGGQGPGPHGRTGGAVLVAGQHAHLF